MNRGEIGDGDEEEEETFVEWFQSKANETFIQNLPMDTIKDLPAVYMYVVGGIAEALAFTLFIYFIYEGYQSGLSQQFMSLQQSAGVCEEVPASLTGTFLADTNGNWVSNPKFSYSLAIYQFSFQSFAVTSQEYRNYISDIQDVFIYLQNISARLNLAENLMYWMTLSLNVNSNSTDIGKHNSITTNQQFAMTGSPEYVFARTYSTGTLSNVLFGCSANGTVTFDAANHLLSLTYDINDYVANDCSKIGNPVFLGYDPLYSLSNFNLKFDINSLMIAHAVNQNILSVNADTEVGKISFLQPVVNGLSLPIYFKGGIYQGREYISPLYPGMVPIYCIQYVGAVNDTPVTTRAYNESCGVRVGKAVMFPVMNSWGANPSSASFPPEYCQCDVENGGPGEGWAYYCNEFDLLVGAIFYSFENVTEVDDNIASEVEIEALLYMQSLVPQGLINKAAYNASFTTGVGVYDDADIRYFDTNWRESAFEFCDLVGLNMTCSMIIFNLYDFNISSVSAYSYQLLHGSCNNVLSVDDVAWEKLKEYPPALITQDYYKCTEDSFDAAFSAVGIASGNVQVAVPIVVFLCLPLMFLFLRLIGQVPPRKEYEKDEVEDALNALGKQLLRMRDGKTRGMKLNGALYHLTKELISAAKQEGGYPDSDDSQEEDSDEEPDSGGIASTDGPTSGIMLKSVRKSTVASSEGRASTKLARVRLARASGTSISDFQGTPVKYDKGKTKGAVFVKQLEEPAQSQYKFTAPGDNPMHSHRGSAGGSALRGSMSNRRSRKFMSKRFRGPAPWLAGPSQTPPPGIGASLMPAPKPVPVFRPTPLPVAVPKPTPISQVANDVERGEVDSDDEDMTLSKRVTTAQPVSTNTSNCNIGVPLALFEREDAYEEVLALNIPEEDYQIPDSYKSLIVNGFIPIERVPKILSDIRNLLGECLMYEQKNKISGVRGLARDCPKFALSVIVANSLKYVNLNAALEKNKTDPNLFIQLHTILCMHGSISLNKSLDVITDRFSKEVAYLVHDRVLTAADIHDLCGDDGSFRTSQSA